MAKGTVKWFNATKGYGFIQPSGGGKDVFVHISAVEKAGLSNLNEGQTVEYEIVSNRGKNPQKISRFDSRGHLGRLRPVGSWRPGCPPGLFLRLRPWPEALSVSDNCLSQT